MNVKQCRMARAGLKWTTADLAAASGIHRVTIARFESGKPVDPETVSTLSKALEKAGAQFTRRQAGRIGVSVPD